MAGVAVRLVSHPGEGVQVDRAFQEAEVALGDHAYRAAVVDQVDRPFQAGEEGLADLLGVVEDPGDQVVQEDRRRAGVGVPAEHRAGRQEGVEEAEDHQVDPFQVAAVVAEGHRELLQAAVAEVGDHRGQADQDELSLPPFSA